MFRLVCMYSGPSQKMRLEMARVGNEGSAYQPPWLFSLALAIWAVEQPDPWQSCRFLEPLRAQGAQSAPCQKPTLSQSSPNALEQKVSPSTTIKNEGHHKRKNTITNVFFPAMAQSQGRRQPRNCSPEADLSHGPRANQRGGQGQQGTRSHRTPRLQRAWTLCPSAL